MSSFETTLINELLLVAYVYSENIFSYHLKKIDQ